MEEALEELPFGLEEAFEETLGRVRRQPDSQKDLGINILMWLTYARRPMLIVELSEALAIRLGTGVLNSKYHPWQKQMVDSCMGLVLADESSAAIRLVHYSVQEYLYKHRDHIFGKGEEAIAEKSLTYLLFEPFARGPRQLQTGVQELVAKNPFAAYAARNWGDHVRGARTEELDPLTLKFLQAEAQRGCSYQIVHHTGKFREEYWKAEEANSINGLHLAATFGLDRLGKRLLDAGQVRVDDTSRMGSTALINAAAGGHRAFIRMLLQEGADHLEENWYGMALHCAAEAGMVSSILQLVENGTSVDLRDRRGRTPLHCATVSGHEEAMKTLLEQGADVNAECNKNYTALRYAIIWEQPLVLVQVLLERGADTNVPSNHGATPLHDAAVMNSEQTLLLLLRHKADINAREAHGGTPLHFAAERDHASIVHHLLRWGANVDAKTTDGVTPLYLAAGNGGVKSMRVLVDANADVEACDNDGLTPLSVAVWENRANVVSMLLEVGANAGAKDEEGRTLFDVATKEGYQTIAKLIQEAGATNDIMERELAERAMKINTPYNSTRDPAEHPKSESGSLMDSPSLSNDAKVYLPPVLSVLDKAVSSSNDEIASIVCGLQEMKSSTKARHQQVLVLKQRQGKFEELRERLASLRATNAPAPALRPYWEKGLRSGISGPSSRPEKREKHVN